MIYVYPSVIISICTWCGPLQIYQRGLPPGGGGKVYFSCPIVKRMKPLLLNEVGKVKRVRGVSYLLSILFPFSFSLWVVNICSILNGSFTMCRYSLKVSPIMNSRLVDSAKGVLNNFLPDVYIYADHVKGNRTSTYVCMC